jgi:hypothetical protein
MTVKPTYKTLYTVTSEGSQVYNTATNEYDYDPSGNPIITTGYCIFSSGKGDVIQGAGGQMVEIMGTLTTPVQLVANQVITVAGSDYIIHSSNPVIDAKTGLTHHYTSTLKATGDVL